MRNVVLYRKTLSHQEDQAEINALQKAGFIYIKTRSEIEPGDFVVPRYSALPFFNELTEDVANLGGKLINNLWQHNYVADLKNWIVDLGELTPETWDRLECIPDEGPFVLKGATNSKKFYWKTHMFAKNKQEASQVHSRLLSDSVIGYQDIYIRKYVKLKELFIGIQDLPITVEFRFFVCNQKIISSAFYWSSHVDELETVPSPEMVPNSFLEECIGRVGDNCNFYTLDVAITEQGNPIVIELNDGCMSGLSENDPEILYTNLFKEIQSLAK